MADALVVLVVLTAINTAGALSSSTRRAAFRLAMSAGVAVGLAWTVLTLLLPGDQTGTLLWRRPSWSPGPGISFGGPLTTSGLIDGVTSALTAVTVVLALGLLGQTMCGARWQGLADSLLRGFMPLVAPICRLGDAAVSAEIEAARARRWGIRRGPLQSGLLRRAARIAADETSRRGHRGPGSTVVEAAGFSCSLPGRGVVLREVSFEAVPGVTALVGATGSGTSTLLRAISGLLPDGAAVRGTLRVGGLDASLANRAELGAVVRLVTPGRLFGGTVAELLGTWLGPADEPTTSTALGLERWRNRPVGTLPPDVRGLLCLAELRHAPMPGIIAIDQILSACGPEMADGMVAEVRRHVGEGRRILWADHQLDQLWELADHVIELDRGKVASAGAAADWHPVELPEPALMTMCRALGLGPGANRDADALRAAAGRQMGKPVPPARPTAVGVSDEQLTLSVSDIGLDGDRPLALFRTETIGVIDLSGRAESLAARLTAQLRNASRLPATLPTDIPVGALVRSWEGTHGLPPRSILASPEAAGLRRREPLARHGSGDAANLRTAMAMACPAPLWFPHPQLGLDPRRRNQLATLLRTEQTAPRILTSRDHDFLLAACHRILVVDGRTVVGLGAPGAVLRHLPRRPLVARASGTDAIGLAELLPTLTPGAAA